MKKLDWKVKLLTGSIVLYVACLGAIWLLGPHTILSAIGVADFFVVLGFAWACAFDGYKE